MTPADVSIASLIYKSPTYGEFVTEGIRKHTPEGYEFFFVANDATDETIAWLNSKGHRYLDHRNPDPNEYYINRVYRAWNRCADYSTRPLLLLVNSDMYFSPGWLEALLEHIQEDRILVSTLIERLYVTRDFPGVRGNFGMPGRFAEAAWLHTAEMVKGIRPELYVGLREPYMPLMIHRKTFIEVGGYPEGNPRGISGDRVLFDALADRGVNHYICGKSVAYHIGEGEMRS